MHFLDGMNFHHFKSLQVTEIYTSKQFLLSRNEKKGLIYTVKCILFNKILFLVQIKILPLHTEKAFTKLLVACGSVLEGTERDNIDSHNKESRIGEF